MMLCCGLSIGKILSKTGAFSGGKLSRSWTANEQELHTGTCFSKNWFSGIDPCKLIAPIGAFMTRFHIAVMRHSWKALLRNRIQRNVRYHLTVCTCIVLNSFYHFAFQLIVGPWWCAPILSSNSVTVVYLLTKRKFSHFDTSLTTWPGMKAYYKKMATTK